MNYDNLIEVAMYSNSVGRRDMQTIPGNANMIAKKIIKLTQQVILRLMIQIVKSYVFKKHKQ